MRDNSAHMSPMPTIDPRRAPDAPLISVALCVHNGARYLREQLDSVLAQRDVAIEVIALDDASIDTSMEILEEYASRDPRIRYVRNETNLGATRSFERAMSLARGRFIAPCDQDDIWEPDKLARLLAVIGEADLAYCDSAYIDAIGAPTGKCVSDDIDMLAGHEPLTFLFANSVSGHAALLRRELLDIARPFPVHAFHDWWLALCAAARGGIVYLPEPLVRFRRHAGTASTLGRDRKAAKPPSRYRPWIEQRHSIMTAHAHGNLRGHLQAQTLLRAFDTARDHNRWLPLLRELWRQRGVLPGHGSHSVRTLRWWLRFKRKLRRSRAEMESPVRS